MELEAMKKTPDMSPFVCTCGSTEYSQAAPDLYECTQCGRVWRWADTSWAEVVPEAAETTPGEGSNPDEYSCLAPGCEGVMMGYSPVPGKHALRCQACGMQGPLADSEASAGETWSQLLSYVMEDADADTTPAVTDDSDGHGHDHAATDGTAVAAPHVHAPFSMAVAERLRDMRDTWPPLNSCEEGAAYLHLRLQDYFDWLATRPDDRVPEQGLCPLVGIAATARRIAEDRGLDKYVCEPQAEDK